MSTKVVLVMLGQERPHCLTAHRINIELLMRFASHTCKNGLISCLKGNRSRMDFDTYLFCLNCTECNYLLKTSKPKNRKMSYTYEISQFGF